MKKYFICVMASLLSTIAFAQKDEVVVKDVIMYPGGTAQMEVALNNPSKEYTALQFKLSLPEGISIAPSDNGKSLKASLNRAVATDHELVVSQEKDNTYIFIVFSRRNAAFTGAGTIASITLTASDDVKTGELKATTEAVLWVTPEEETAETEGAKAAVIVKNEVIIKISASGKSTLVSGKDLDFSNVDGLKAYIATGYYWPKDLMEMDESVICLTKVEDVPAGTPVLLIGTGDKEFTVPITTSHTYYPANYLKGNAKTDVDVDPSYTNMQLEKGVFNYLTTSTYPAGNCYLQLPSGASSVSGSELEFTMNEHGVQDYVSQMGLDFTNVEGLKAYTVTGVDADKNIMLTRVTNTSNGMPLLLIGTAGQKYKVPSVKSSMFYTYINMLRGDAKKDTDVKKTTEDGFTNCILSNGVFGPLSEDNPAFPAGSCYLPVPTSYLTSATRADSEEIKMSLKETEVLLLNLKDGSVANLPTAIKSVYRSQASDDDNAWYNLNGQRVDTPSKGIYINKGVKVVIK
jgi:hypothetical protein